MSTGEDSRELFMSEITERAPLDGGGFELTLACGHVVHTAINIEAERLYCAECLREYLEQAKRARE